RRSSDLRGAFAQVVEYRGKQHLAVTFIDEHAQLYVVGAVHGLGIQVRHGAGLRQWQHLHVLHAGEVLFKAGVQARAVDAGWQQPQLDGYGQHNALAIRAIRGHEERAVRQRRMQRDFGGVLVFQGEPIYLRRRRALRRSRLVRVDGGPAAPRIAGYGMNGQGVVARQQAGGDQGPQQRDGAGGVAARVGDTGRDGATLRLAVGQFRQATQLVGPPQPGSGGP